MKKLFFIAFLVVLGAGQLSAQVRYSLNGYITDGSNGEALIGVTVYVRNIEKGTATNVYGFYSLTLPAGTYELEFSYIGYQSVEQTVTLNQDLRLDIELSQEGKTLEEVVITDKAVD